MTTSRARQLRPVLRFAFALVAVLATRGSFGEESGHATPPAPKAKASSVILVDAPSFARGPGQPIAVSTRGVGLPLRVRRARDVRRVELRIDYDRALLDVTRIEPTSGGTIRTERTGAGSLHVRFEATGVFGASDADDAPVTFARLVGTVPNRAPYRAKNRISITDVSVNDGGVEAQGSTSLHLVAYPGDTSGNGSFSSLDASHILRLGLRLDTRLESFANVDSRLVADVTGDGRITRDDARHVLLEVVGVGSDHVPDLPGVLPPVFVVGPDPRVDIPTDLSGPAGSTVTGPVEIDTAAGLIAADIRLSYDTTILDVSGTNGFRRGDVMSDPSGLIVGNLQEDAGLLIVGIAVTTPRSAISGAILEVDYEIGAEAPAGPTPLNLESVSLNENGLELNPVPQEAPDDETDGRLEIEPTDPFFVRGDSNSSDVVDLTDGVVTLNFLFTGGVEPKCLDAADTDNNGTLVINDAVITFSYLFTGGPPPMAPSPSATNYPPEDCGPDTDVSLGCEDTATKCQ